MDRRKSFEGSYPREYQTFKRLNTPWAIQDFLDRLPYNLKGDTWYSPIKVLHHRTADCIEGAIFAAAALYLNGHDPLLVDLVADPKKDDDHIIAVYRINSLWGAIAKSKFSGLRYRDPVYRNIRELVMSYFDDYINEQGEKTLIKFSKKPLNLKIFGEKWLDSENVFFVAEKLIEREKTDSYEEITPKSHKIRLRRADRLLLKAGMLGYPKKKK